MTAALPPVVDTATWQRQLEELRARRRRRPVNSMRSPPSAAACRWCKMPDYVLEGEHGPVRLADVFEGRRAARSSTTTCGSPGQEWQCPGCTGFTSQYTRLEFLDNCDARFVIVTQGPIDEALAYRRRTGNKMTWYSTANSSFGADRRRAARGRVRGQCLLARGGHGLPHLAYRWPRYRAAQPYIPAYRPAALRAPGRMAGRRRTAGRSRLPTAGGAAPRTSLRPTGPTRRSRPGDTGLLVELVRRVEELPGHDSHGDITRAAWCRWGPRWPWG